MKLFQIPLRISQGIQIWLQFPTGIIFNFKERIDL